MRFYKKNYKVMLFSYALFMLIYNVTRELGKWEKSSEVFPVHRVAHSTGFPYGTGLPYGKFALFGTLNLIKI